MRGWLILLLLTFVAYPLQGDQPQEKRNVPASPLSPEEERKTFQLAPGLRIDLVASEPLIQSPVACAFAPDGRLWVVEMGDYPNGPAPGQPAQGIIKILTDDDGDGVYDRATTFADGLLFANGIRPWGNGVIVTMAPQILYLEDTTGDGKADRKEVLYEGFTAGNPQLRVSHPQLGPDGWIYVANGLRGGSIQPAGQANAPALPLGGKDFRFHMEQKRGETIPGMGQFGNTFDRWGQRFVCDNRNHLRHVVFPIDPGSRNPLIPARPLVHDPAGPSDGPLSSGARVFPLSRNWTTSNLHAGRFSAACGIYVDQGGLLPAPFENAVFTCEPTGNLVHMETLEPQGATFRSRPWKEGVEFLASPDEWFRPVFLTQAPDGAMILVDMYRAVIEHPEFMPLELKNRPDLMLGKERGRIWRIAPQDAPPQSYRPGLDRADLKTLVNHLGDPRGWHRTTAQMLLAQRKEVEVLPLLRAYLKETQSPEGTILAAWLLQQRDALSTEDVTFLSKHAHPRVREHAVKLQEAGTPTLAMLEGLTQDPDARVRFETILALSRVKDDAAIPLLAEAGVRDGRDTWASLAVATASVQRPGRVLAKMLSNLSGYKPQHGVYDLVQQLSALAASSKDPAEINTVLRAIGSSEAHWQSPALLGLAEGASRVNSSLLRLASQGKESPELAEFFQKVIAPGKDHSASDKDRSVAIRLMGYLTWKQVREPLLTILADPRTPQPLRIAAIRSLSAHTDPEVTTTLLKNWRSQTPAMRIETTEALLRRPERVQALLDAVEAGQVRPGDIDIQRTRRLLASKDPTIAKRARALLQASLPADRQQVLAQYRKALELPGDARKGRDVFVKHCAACHVVAGLGTQVAPDISDTRTKTAEMLLTDILNPNAAIDGNYVAYAVTTFDGKSFQGIITAESDAGITLKRDGNQTETILRNDIDEIKSTGLSLMPDGLEQNISVQDMADLLRFLKDWRYLDGATPIKKD